ncbi:hypothetical protein IFM89_004888 [Coptis chinensis]|uniref:Acid phosphatase/vanadium-dependent haloperoxidase-related protein n=1 Tax=Coptis chinensis TaxID=261450 RepID=A0A835I1J9_9MAGN|nr:hypothetical protein IFM89_004888 [Coptis chinensis]
MDEVMTSADASSPPPSSSHLLISNLPLLSAFLAFALAQFLKLFTTWYKEKRWDSKRMFGSGGMPSSHSATVTALSVAIGLQDGLVASSFALSVVLAAVVMYDASGVRLHAGRQAEGLLSNLVTPDLVNLLVRLKGVGKQLQIFDAVNLGKLREVISAADYMASLSCFLSCDLETSTLLYFGALLDNRLNDIVEADVSSATYVLNQIVCELPTEHPLSNVRPLRELLGHTPLQVVAGAILGCLVAYLLGNSG